MSGQKSQPDHEKTAEHVAQVLGFVASQHKEAIIHDIYVLTNRKASEQLDGYILAVARCMSHDLAWHCITTAFQRANKPIPDKYYTRFGQNRNEDPIPESRMKVDQ